jgi:hypothetical protein
MTGFTPHDVKVYIEERTALRARFSALFSFLKLLVAVLLVGYMIWYFKPKVTHLMTPTTEVGRTFTTKTGQNFSGKALGYDKDALALKLFVDGTTRYFPIEDLTPADQRFVSGLEGFKIDWPLECTAYDSKGNPVYVTVKGRTADFAILSDPKTGAVDYRPMSFFSAEDQKVFKMLSASPMPHYAFKMTLTDQTGRSIPAVITGRTDLDVKFILANGTSTSYPISKLSPANQDFLRQLSSEYDSISLHRIRDRNNLLEAENLKIQARIEDPSTSAYDRELAQNDYYRNSQEIASNKMKINAEIKNAELVQSQKTAEGALP